MNTRNQRLTTLAVALLVLAVPLTFTMADEEQVEETDAVFPAAIPIIRVGLGLVFSFIGGAVIGGGAVLYWDSNDSFNQSDEAIRNVEASIMYETFHTAIPIYANSMENYANIWPLTSEHFVRQAELASASYWNGTDAYDSSMVLNGSGVYINNSVMMANASEHFNEQFEAVSETIKKWGEGEATEYYGEGKMQVQFWFAGDSVAVDASDTMTAKMGSVVRDVSSGADCVYYAGGPVWVDSAATMTSTDGHTISLNAGWNYLPEQESFDYPGIYRLDSGHTYFATSFTSIISTAEESAATTEVAFIVTTADDRMIVSYDNAKDVLTDGSSTGSLKLRIIADGNPAREQDMSDLLTAFASLQDAITGTTTDANTSARTVWGIYDSAGEASHYLTTLTVPNTYENVQLNEAQKRMMTILSMDQLAEYWKDNGQTVKDTPYEATLDSLSLYVRGSIKVIGSDGTLQTAYEDVIFTPMFYQDTTLTVGTNHQNEMTAFVMIWGDGKSLASFDGSGVKLEETNMMALEPGCQIGITEIKHDGQMKQSVDLDVADIEWIDVEDMHGREPFDPQENDLYQIIQLVFMGLGVCIAAIGVLRKNIILCVVGVAVLVVGVLFSGVIANALEDLFGWRVLF